MKDKYIIILLLDIFVILLIIILDSYINYIDYNVDRLNKKIDSLQIENKNYEKKLNELKNQNSIKQKNIKNMTEYIDSLNKKVKEYE